MKKFFSEMLELGIMAAYKIPIAKEKSEKVSNTINKLLNEEGIDIEEFFDMYDTQVYDFDTKKDDIKIVKKYDFAGVYVIHNCTKNKFFVRKSENVLRKIYRQFRGYENKSLFEDYNNGDKFLIKAVEFDSSIHKNLTALEKKLISKYGVYGERIEKTTKNNIKKSNNESSKTTILEPIFILASFFIMAILLCVFLEFSSMPKENEVKVTINPKDYIGTNYEEVKNKFEEMGFIDIKCIPKEDLISGWINKEGETDKITINKSDFNKDSIFPKDADVEIIYHSFKIE